MKKPIRSYQDLIEQKQELQRLLEIQKAQIRNDFLELKEEVSPALRVASFVGKVTTRDAGKNVMLQTGTNLAIDWLTRKLFPKSNFIFKLLAPAFLKNYTSHFLNGSKKANDVQANTQVNT